VALSFLEPQVQDELKHVPLSNIIVNPYQPRKEFKVEELEELAQSIRAVGLLHPPLVRPLPNSDLYELISGERRFRAAKLVGLSTLPVYIRKTDQTISAQAALIENVQRVDLNPLEIAKALKRLVIEFGFTQDQLAQQIGKKRSTIANYLRLLTLPHLIQESLVKGCISMGHAKAILALNREDEQFLLHEHILRDDLTVREAEQATLDIGKKDKKQPLSRSRDFNLEVLTDKIRERFGTQVSIKAKRKGGCIQINYYNLDDLDRLLTIFGIKVDQESD
jgi:ParB family chromosome partitioning protein